MYKLTARASSHEKHPLTTAYKAMVRSNTHTTATSAHLRDSEHGRPAGQRGAGRRCQQDATNEHERRAAHRAPLAADLVRDEAQRQHTQHDTHHLRNSAESPPHEAHGHDHIKQSLLLTKTSAVKISMSLNLTCISSAHWQTTYNSAAHATRKHLKHTCVYVCESTSSAEQSVCGLP